MITLSDAVKLGRIQEFVAQEEARGIGPADTSELDAALSRLIREPRSEGRTSHSPSPDGSSGKRTR